MSKKESAFQAKLIKELKETYEGAIILKNDPTYLQGFPDITILYKDKWALLECKREENSNKQPNQDYYIQHGNEMSFARFICPENKEEVLDELQRTFKPRRSSRVSRGK